MNQKRNRGEGVRDEGFGSSVSIACAMGERGLER